MSNQEVSRLFIGGASDSPELNEFPGAQLRPSLRNIRLGSGRLLDRGISENRRVSEIAEPR